MYIFKFTENRYRLLTDDFTAYVGTLSIDLRVFETDNSTPRKDIHHKTIEEACKIMSLVPGEYIGYIDAIPTPETHPELLI